MVKPGMSADAVRMAALLFTVLFSLLTRVVHAQDSNVDLAGMAQHLVQSGSVWMTGNTSCEIFDGTRGRRNAYDGSDAEALLEVAKASNIYLFAHGFNPNPLQTRPTMPDVRKAWAQQLRLLNEVRRPYAACLFAVDSTAGFGDHQPEIGDFLFALRWLTDQPQLYDPERWVTLVGHSSGANYLKQAHLKFQQHLAANNKPVQGLQPTNMLYVFLAGQHRAFYSTGDAVQTSGPAEAYRELLTRSFDGFWSRVTSAGDPLDAAIRRQNSERDAALYARLMNSRGAQQLQPSNTEIDALNRQFLERITDNVKIVDVAVAADDLGDMNWAGAGHDVVTHQRIGLFDIVNPYADASLLSTMRALYTDHGPAISTAPGPAIFQCGRRRCSSAPNGQVLFESRDGRYWFYQDGAVAPSEMWPNG